MITYLGDFIPDAVEEIHQALIALGLRDRAINCYASLHVFSVNLSGRFIFLNWLRTLQKRNSNPDWENLAFGI